MIKQAATQSSGLCRGCMPSREVDVADTTAADRIQCHGKPDDTAPDWSRTAFLRDLPQCLHVVEVEIRYSPVTNFARQSVFPSRQPSRQRRSYPTSAISRDQDSRFSADADWPRRRQSLLSARIPRIYLRHREYALTQAVQRLTNDLFRSAIGIHFSGIDERQPCVDARTECRDFRPTMTGILPIYHVPCPIAGKIASPAKTTCLSVITSSFTVHHRNAKQGASALF